MLVALTRERGHNDNLRHWVGSRAEVVETPLTTTQYRSVADVEREIRATGSHGTFRCLVVTSARAQRYLACALDALDEGSPVLSVGHATSEMLAVAGVKVMYEAAGAAAELAPLVREGPVLILGATGGRDELVRALSDARSPSLVGCYQTLPATMRADERVQLRRADVVFVGAPSAWRAARRDVSEGTWVLVPGVTTLEAVRSEHSRVLVGWGEDFEDAWRLVIAST